jgi:hypothetical protein
MSVGLCLIVDNHGAHVLLYAGTPHLEIAAPRFAGMHSPLHIASVDGEQAVIAASRAGKPLFD